MAETWNLIFEGVIENRPVKIEVYDDGAFAIHTNQGADHPFSLETDGSSTSYFPPTLQGRNVTIHGETPDEIRNGLLSEGFSDAAANEIIGKLPA